MEPRENEMCPSSRSEPSCHAENLWYLIRGAVADIAVYKETETEMLH